MNNFMGILHFSLYKPRTNIDNNILVNDVKMDR